MLPPPAIVTCSTTPKPFLTGEEETRFSQFILMKFECLKSRHKSPCKDVQAYKGKEELCQWLLFSFVVEMVLASSFLNFPAIRPCEWLPVVSDNRGVPVPPGCREQK